MYMQSLQTKTKQARQLLGKWNLSYGYRKKLLIENSGALVDLISLCSPKQKTRQEA